VANVGVLVNGDFFILFHRNKREAASSSKDGIEEALICGEILLNIYIVLISN
jgi:hypothetical protein